MSLFKFWKNWSRKEKTEWFLSLLVSGSDYSDDIENKRLNNRRTD